MSKNKKLCKCGCGQIVKPGNRFINGHSPKSKLINNWIEENQGKHLCKCGCGEYIIIQRFHYRRGIPKYIICHHRLNKEDIIKQNKSNKRKIDKFIEENQGKHFCHCGCGGEIIIQRYHYRSGIPKYIWNHYVKDEKNKSCIKKTIVLCNYCGNKIEKYQYEIHKTNFCDQKCYKNWKIGRKLTEKTKRKISESNKRMVIVTCDYCNNKIEKTRSWVSDKNFCDHKCMGLWMSENLSGENASGWKGGISFGKYCQLFNPRFKEIIRILYNRRCFMCGKSEKENGQRLDVHHVNYDKDCLCGSPCEFVPLCRSCHSKTNYNRKYWEDLIMYYLYPERYFMIEI